ncbi:hypothetical protein [Paenibacillus sp. ISL-20]|uniref:hypothetical protein n=1 Tax=Paenibacillus sp. ISL-20 TaxID=2819163 RepID=UPI001BEBE144|nr:hypothetical protein [Paenibacillus sp. ISL-20]MBT2759926.1 hypothetical protein [Paenibacillus sp. ISL-20]
MTKKSNHKHEYELVEIKQGGWFTHEKACKICGHLNSRLRVDNESNIQKGED